MATASQQHQAHPRTGIVVLGSGRQGAKQDPHPFSAEMRWYWRHHAEILERRRQKRAVKKAAYLAIHGERLAAERLKRAEETKRQSRVAEKLRRKRRLARMRVEEPEKFREFARRRERKKSAKRSGSTKRRAYERAWQKAHAHERRERNRLKRLNEPNFRLADVVRSRIYCALKGRRKTGSAVKLLGCTIDEAVRHLERQFRPGMSWANHGPTWHVDHIRPLAGFDLADPDQLAQACHFTNLRPLPARENIAKSDKQVFLI